MQGLKDMMFVLATSIKSICCIPAHLQVNRLVLHPVHLHACISSPDQFWLAPTQVTSEASSLRSACSPLGTAISFGQLS